MSNADEFTSTVLHFLKKAGKIALNCQEHPSAALKPDRSIVTQADLNISKLFREAIGKYLKLGNHAILDEEEPQSTADFFINGKEYTWVIDPIDGSTTYYRGFPLWAIAVCLYRNFKPYIGAIYMPSTGDLVYSDGGKSYYVRKAFRRGESTVLLEAKNSSLIGKDIVLSRRCCDPMRGDYAVLDLYSNYVMSIYILTNRGICQFFRGSSKFWDVAASIVIAKNMGLCFRSIENGKDFDILSQEVVDSSWAMKSIYIMCNPSVYDTIIGSNLLPG